MNRIALVGDSHLTDASERSATKLGPRLRRLGFDVVTYARGGNDTREAVLEPVPTDADWIVYCFGTNDAAPWKRVPPAEFAANYAALLRSTAGRGQLVLGPPPVRPRLSTVMRSNRVIARYSTLARQAARMANAHFLSLVDVLDRDALADDGVHLNDDGYGTIARLVIPIVRSRPDASPPD